MSKKCEAIINKNGKQCGSNIIIEDEYCVKHAYFGSLSDELIGKIKSGDESVIICNKCRHWHDDLNKETGKPFAVCSKCKTNKTEIPKDNICQWCVNFDAGNEYVKNKNTVLNRRMQQMNTFLGVQVAPVSERVYGYDKFPKCTQKKFEDTDYCCHHQHAIQYTEEEKNKVSDCSGCGRVVLLNDSNKKCDVCDTRIVNGNLKNSKINETKKNPCDAIVKGIRCTRNKYENNDKYCEFHVFIPERTEENIKLGILMCEINNISYEDFNEPYPCVKCSIIFMFGTSRILNGNTSLNCPHCVLHFRETDAERDRTDRDYKTYERTLERIEARKIYKEANYAKYVSYWIMARGKKILELGIDEYRRQNNEYMRKKRLMNPEKQAIIYHMQKTNLKYKYGYYKRNAEDKGRQFELSYEQCELFFLDDCFYCGGKAIRGEIINGIDRIDNTIGYVLDNCVPSCNMCNMLKGPYFNHIEFLLVCNHILTNLNIINGFYSPLVFKDYITRGYFGYMESAEKRGYEFKITNEQYNIIIKDNCYLCGKSNSETHNNGIDRVNNNIGYVFENCKSCCGSCNMLKKNYELNELLKKLINICSIHYDNMQVVQLPENVMKSIIVPCSGEIIKTNKPLDETDIDDINYINELGMLLNTNESIENIIETLNDEYENNFGYNNVISDEYKKEFINTMNDQGNPLSVKQNEGVGKKQINAKNTRKLKKDAGKPQKDNQMILKYTDSEIIKLRSEEINNKRKNINDIVENKIDVTIKSNYDIIMCKHRDDTREKLQIYHTISKKI